MPDKYFKKILTSNVYDVAKETPLDFSRNLSQKLGNQIFIKREDLQPVFSFKIRGAYNKMSHLSREKLDKGVVTASAGNHAQGVALAAKTLKCQATIVMPVSTPQIKVDAVKNLKAKVLLHGDTYFEAETFAKKLAKSEKMSFIHPYDDPDVIAGQGTIAMEILRQCTQPIHAIFVCVGGGGLISGVASYIKFLKPEIKVIGVQPVDASAMHDSLQCNKRIYLDAVGGFADGVAVKQVGKETFRICRKFVDEIILVSTDAICAAIKDIFEDTRALMEPSGALGVAGMTAYVKQHKLKDKTLVTITSGANMNFHRLRHVSERAELGEQREAVLAVTVPEKPGSFRALIKILGKCRITEFNYRRGSDKEAHIFMGVEIQDQEELKHLIQKIRMGGLGTMDLTANEMAKLHLRHMVGGKCPQVKDEVFYRFEFPERAGALTDFLQNLSPNWNISLFHYRNHGTDYGRVFVGLEISSKDKTAFQKSLDKLGYKYWDETGNPACPLFL